MIPAHLKPAMGRVVGPLRQRFEALQPRERLLIIVVGVALVWALAQGRQPRQHSECGECYYPVGREKVSPPFT